MKIIAIGDPHGNLSKIKNIPIKDINLILLTGDLGKADLMRRMLFENIEREKKGLSIKEYSPKQEKRAFMEAYQSSMKIIRYLSRIAPVYTIYGNVESNNIATRSYSKRLGLSLPYLTNDLNDIDGVKVINNRIANFDGVKIGGLEYFIDTSWVREFKPSEYRKIMKRAKRDTEKAKKVVSWFDTLDILLCHQPPFEILDKVKAPAPKHWRGKRAGSKVILKYIKRKQPKYVFCAHIHEGEGKKKVGKTEVYNLGVGGYKIVKF